MKTFLTTTIKTLNQITYDKIVSVYSQVSHGLFGVRIPGWVRQQTVSGTVTSSDDGTSVPGVNIVEKGTNNGTVTDSGGAFKISVGNSSTLVFSFVGYASQEVVVGSQTTLNVTLVSDVTALSEVVVTGYGSQEKKEITGAVVSLDTKDFNKGNVNDPHPIVTRKGSRP